MDAPATFVSSRRTPAEPTTPSAHTLALNPKPFRPSTKTAPAKSRQEEYGSFPLDENFVEH